MTFDNRITDQLKTSGQVAHLEALDQFVDEFEAVLKENGISIKHGSDLEGTCLAITEVLGKHKDPGLRDPMQDIRPLFSTVLGFWLFITKIVRLRAHPGIKQFAPHFALLNEGTVVQNTKIKVCEEATNKIFELLFACSISDQT